MIKNFNNKTQKVGDDLKETIKKYSEQLLTFSFLFSKLGNVAWFFFFITEKY